jgi:5'-3' exonuclease
LESFKQDRNLKNIYMNDGILILDMPAICYHEFYRHANRCLTVDDVLADVCRLIMEYKTTKIVWCFDSKKSLRKEILPCYKEKRKQDAKKQDPELQERVIECKQLTKQLRSEILPDFGYTSIWQVGLESDDMIAAVCRSLRYVDKTIISVDYDLFQLLDSKTKMFSPSQGKFYTASWFEKEYGILPKQWSLVKAIAGCSSDNVPGVVGVGEKTAIAYVRNELKPGKKFDAIESNFDLIQFNKQLVKLPHKETHTISVPQDKITDRQWKDACKRWDVQSWAWTCQFPTW